MTDLTAPSGGVRIDGRQIAKAFAPLFALAAIAAGVGILNPAFLSLMSLQNLMAEFRRAAYLGDWADAGHTHRARTTFRSRRWPLCRAS